MAAVMSCAILRAETGEPFLKIGASYFVLASKDTPLPGSTGIGAISNDNTLKIIKIGNNQWCWVEYDQPQQPSPVGAKPEPVTIFKVRVWFNFAQATTVTPGGEIDYSRNYPQGFKIIPYKER
jgi:hypothetical protein